MRVPDKNLKEISISDLLTLHRRHRSKNSLAHSLLDGYALSANPLLAAVRIKTLKRGYQFSCVEHSCYHAWPLMGLDYVLEKKTVPYLDNVTILEYVAGKSSRRINAEDLMQIDRPKMNVIHHESCHILAFEFLTEARKNSREPTPKNKSAFATQSLSDAIFAESIANAAEAMTTFLSWKKPFDRFALYHFHSQIIIYANEYRSLKKLTQKIGVVQVFKSLFGAYLYLNLLFRSVLKSQQIETLKVLGVRKSDGSADDFDTLFSVALKLNPAAPVHSTFNYQYFTGIAQFDSIESFIDNLKLSPIELLSKSPAYLATVDLFVSAIFTPGLVLSYNETFNQV